MSEGGINGFPFFIFHFMKRKKRQAPLIPQFELTEQDYFETLRALERIGYDITKDIHIQFKDKIRTKYGVYLPD